MLGQDLQAGLELGLRQAEFLFGKIVFSFEEKRVGLFPF